MNITIHRGTDQIGGCVTEYEYNGWRLFVDYGEQLPGTPKTTLRIEGLTYGDLSKSALLITHYHGDHIGNISDIATDIPVYMGYTGCEIYRKLQRRLSRIQGEEGKKAQKAYKRSGLINTFIEDEEFKFGPFLIHPVKMDHSAYDSYGFVISITEEDIRVFHTGDFRAHGSIGKEFLRTISMLPPIDTIVCEATNIERSQHDANPEWEIEQQFKALFKENKFNSVFVSSTNIDRLFGIYRAAADAGRIVLMDEYQFDIINSVIGENDWLRNESHKREFNKGLPFVLKLDKFSRDTPKFFIPDKLWQLIKWKGCVLIARQSIQFESLIESLKYSQKYLSQWSGYINPNSPAYNQSLARLLGTDYEYVHTSGHADIHTLETLFEKINGVTKIIPIHTDNPTKFMEVFSQKWPVLLLKDGEIYSLSGK